VTFGYKKEVIHELFLVVAAEVLDHGAKMINPAASMLQS